MAGGDERLHPPWGLLLRLCLVGFFVNCQPSEPFLARYLMEDKGLSEWELDNLVWPADTYGSLVLLLPLGLLAECWSYRGTVLVGLFCRQATRSLLLFGRGVGAMQLMQWTYAGAVGAEAVAYFALPYRTVTSPLHFPAATAAVRGACHAGNALGSGIGQALVSSGCPLRVLFYLSWAFATAGLACFPLLPSTVDDTDKTRRSEGPRRWRWAWMGSGAGRGTHVVAVAGEADDDNAHDEGEDGANGQVAGGGGGAYGSARAPSQPAAQRVGGSLAGGCATDGPAAVLRELAALFAHCGADHDRRVGFRARRRRLHAPLGGGGGGGGVGGDVENTAVENTDDPPVCSWAMVSSVLRSRLGAWSAWWAVGVATNQIFGNYYQNVLYRASPNAPGGTVELLMGVAAAVATLGVAVVWGSGESRKTRGRRRMGRRRYGDDQYDQYDQCDLDCDDERDDQYAPPCGGGGSSLFRHALSVLVGTSAAWAALVAVLCSAFAGLAWPPALTTACTLCVVIDALYAFQLAAAAVVISTECASFSSAAAAPPRGSGDRGGASEGANLASDSSNGEPFLAGAVPGGEAERGEPFSGSNDMAPAAAVGAQAGCNTRGVMDGAGEGRRNPLLTLQEHARAISSSRDSSDLGSGCDHHHQQHDDGRRQDSPGDSRRPRYAMVFTVASLLGLAIAAATQGLVSACAAASGGGGLKTRGYFTVATIQEVFIIPVVLLPHGYCDPSRMRAV